MIFKRIYIFFSILIIYMNTYSTTDMTTDMTTTMNTAMIPTGVAIFLNIIL